MAASEADGELHQRATAIADNPFKTGFLFQHQHREDKTCEPRLDESKGEVRVRFVLSTVPIHNLPDLAMHYINTGEASISHHATIAKSRQRW